MIMADLENDESIEESIIHAFDEAESGEAGEVERDDADLEQTIEAAYDEAKDNLNDQGDKGQTTEKPSPDKVREAAKTLSAAKKSGGKKRQVVEAADLEPTKQAQSSEKETATARPSIQPPARWSLERKEWFNRQPPEAQEEIAKGWSDIERHTTKVWQDLSRAANEYGDYKKIVDHYLPQWNLKGISGPQAIAELCATQHYLVNNPVKGIAELCRKMGVDPDDVAEVLVGGGGRETATATPRQVAAPQQNYLTPDRVNELIEQRLHERLVQAETERALTELRSLQQERNSNGSYLYPELHDPNQVARVQALVTSLGETQPHLSLVEKTKRAITTIRILDNGGASVQSSQSPVDSKLTPQQIDRARSASAVTVRGRGKVTPVLTEAPTDERIEDSIKAVLASYGTNY